MALASIPLGLVATSCPADSYSCVFNIEDGLVHTTLSGSGDNWQMEVAEYATSPASTSEFRSVKTATDGTLYLTSTDFDVDAEAVSLLSIAPDGTTHLSVHGAFPGPAAELFYGTCEERN